MLALPLSEDFSTVAGSVLADLGRGAGLGEALEMLDVSFGWGSVESLRVGSSSGGEGLASSSTVLVAVTVADSSCDWGDDVFAAVGGRMATLGSGVGVATLGSSLFSTRTCIVVKNSCVQCTCKYTKNGGVQTQDIPTELHILCQSTSLYISPLRLPVLEVHQLVQSHLEQHSV